MRSLILLALSLLPACGTEKPTDTGDVFDTGPIGEQCDWYLDLDCDGHGDAARVATCGCDEPCESTDGCGYVANGDDCDDAVAATFPGAEELCDGADNDCDTAVDEDLSTETWYADADGDGFGDPVSATSACVAPTGWIADGTDCNDGDASDFPGATERCDDLDNDCDGGIDEDLVFDWYADTDADGYGDALSPVSTCDPGPGYVADATDCNDTNPSAYPGAGETCDFVDNDCDGTVDDGLLFPWYRDADGDGWGSDASSIEACDPGTGYVMNADDCDDNNSAISPDAVEICDHLDNDCDGLLDDADPDVTGTTAFYLDADADGYGVDALVAWACEAPHDRVAIPGDCDDADARFNPGAVESDCADPTDYNCDGSTGYTDADADGFAACVECDDGDAAVFPGADETCDGRDGDCDGVLDNDAVDAPTWYADADDDGFGDALVTVPACLAPVGFVADATDCDDGDPLMHPAAAEICDSIDNDCDGALDEGVMSTFYADRDDDGYGDATSPTYACAVPSGFADDATDCDDSDIAANPGATEFCDGVDDDCDGVVDEDDAADAPTWYYDRDGDGWGDNGRSRVSCTQPAGYFSVGDDCDDQSDTVYPEAPETCNNIDDDCDGTVDDGALLTWYLDTDGDGYGNPTVSREDCTRPAGFVANANDCDDSLSSIRPGAVEVCNNRDDDCDGNVDEGVTSTWYADTDGDGHGDPASTRAACVGAPGWVGGATDCDDTNAAVHPGAAEICNGLDDDCDGGIDELGAVGEPTWYLDYDHDGYGLDGTGIDACSAPSPWYVSSGGDCLDTDTAFHPGAAEGCDGLDHDCDGDVDSDVDGDGYADAACGGDDCNDADPTILPEIGGGCALGTTCLDILNLGRASGDGSYTIDPDGYGTGLDPFDVECDMSTDGGGWTQIAYAADFPFIQHFTGGDAWRFQTSDFTFVLERDEIEAIQDLSTEGWQIYEGLCEHVIHYYYNGGVTYGYAFGFRFLDGSETAYGASTYTPYDISVLQDGCATNGGEGGDPSRATLFHIEGVQVPILNVRCRDCGDTFPELYGSPLTDNPAWLR